MSEQKTVIFDFDGTLANSVDLIFNLYNEYADEFGYQHVTWDEIPGLRRMSYAKAMKAKNVKARRLPKILLTLSKEMHSRMDDVLPYEGIVEVLGELHNLGYSVGVLTSNQALLVNAFFKKHNFPAFDFVVSEKTIFGKDKALKRIIKRFGLDKTQLLYVGDEPRDVVASHKAGIRVIGVSWGIAGIEGFEKVKPDVLAHTPAELLSAIKQINPQE